MDWKKYETEVHELFLEEFPEADIQYDVKVDGRYTNTKRQIDVLIEDYVGGNRLRIVVDAKFFSKKIDVKAVESFIGMLADVDAHKGLLITQKGYSEAAIKRAYYGPEDIELDILNFNQLKEYQGFGAIPFAGGHGALIPAPFGWVIDNRTSEAGLAFLYQRGLDLEQAQSNHEWMYVQLWNREKDGDSLEDLLSLQQKSFMEFDPSTKLTYRNSVKRNDGETRLRIAEISKYPGPEITGFVEFEKFIFFCVLFTPKEVSNRNIRKLENIIRQVRPCTIKLDETTSNPKT